ncbi:hypothetical protein NIES2119_22030 [[Phormidium ambiguum] IAM M-71]|uniref:Uncharacterized protein n=1 Tax=[Phormidium ambiguum] IAM M-71 TaxID=454136 RepID=A0A1U7IBN1_9CYAN|nr:hypothetical protein NIES2119_22030 [Phormidium ambiguum IAM M-71]
MLSILESKLMIACFLYLLKDMTVGSVVKAELFYGALRSNNLTRTLQQQQEFLRDVIALSKNFKGAIS